MAAPDRVTATRADRRAFVVGALALAASPRPTDAQAPAKTAVIGVLNVFSPEHSENRSVVEVLRQALSELGHVEGRNVAFEHRWAHGQMERFPALAGELVRLRVDVIVAGSTQPVRAARQATTTIPIVGWSMQDPVRDGLVASFAQPGGNVTGLTFLGPQLATKLLGLLKDAVPRMSRAAALFHPGGLAERTGQEMAKEAEDAARAMGVQLHLARVRAPSELDEAFAEMARTRVDGFIVLPSPMLYLERRRVASAAARHRLAGMYNAREYADLGGLMSYGASIPDLIRRGAAYVDRILKGARPADLPVQQPTRFELAINLKTAKALGLTIPPSLLARADHVID
jgi:putative ABC transport system substrate-binding protein